MLVDHTAASSGLYAILVLHVFFRQLTELWTHVLPEHGKTVGAHDGGIGAVIRCGMTSGNVFFGSSSRKL